jgi:hypothetical protein
MHLNGNKRLFVPVAGTALAALKGGVDPGGAWFEAIRTAPLGQFTDYMVAFDQLTPQEPWPSK